MRRIDPLTRAYFRHSPPHGPVVLMYHGIQPGHSVPDWPWAVSLERFRAQLDFLADEGYATPTLHELTSPPADGWPPRTVVITFDDGYVDNLAAFEELTKRGMRASWFIVSGSIGQPPGWSSDGRPHGRLLDESELRVMHAAGMEIGSHSVSHPRLTDIDEIRLDHELLDSRIALEQVIGGPVASFAYPYGDWNAPCQIAVERAGYRVACTTRTGWALRDQNPYQFRRLTIFNTDTTATFARKLCSGSHNIGWGSLLASFWKRRIGVSP